MDSQPKLPEFFEELPQASERHVFWENGMKLPYWKEDGKLVRVEFPENVFIDVRRQRDGRYSASVPGYGSLPRTKDELKLLSALARIARAIALNISLEAEVCAAAAACQQGFKKQRDDLRAATEELQQGSGELPAESRSRNKLPTKADAVAISSGEFINPKQLLGAPGWEFRNDLSMAQ